MKKIFITLAVLFLAAGCNTAGQDSTAYPNQSQTTPAAQNQPTGQQLTPVPNTTPPASAVFHTTLSLGSSGTAVANMQQFLADEGFYIGKDTGIFDQATANSVIAFQNQENITPANGVFGSVEQNSANFIIANHTDWLTTLSNNNQYQNVNHSPVQSPAYSSNGVPAGATAVCGDGTYSFSMHRSGTCSHHGGVNQWLQ